MKRTLSLGMAVVLAGAAWAAASKPLEKPNVLLIVSDDMNVDLACYGHDVVKTPNIDKLRERGVVFDRAYSQYPLCNPSRNSFLSGLYPGTSGNLSNGRHLRETAPDVVTMPATFKDAGYLVTSSGKVFHHEDPDSWSGISDLKGDSYLPEGKPYKFYFPPFGEEGGTQGEGRLLVDDTVPWFQWRSVTNRTDLLIDERIANAALKRLDEAAESDAPFFLAVGFSRPHDPYFAPKEFFDLYPLESLSLPETPKDASAIPDHAFYNVFKDAFDSMDEKTKLEAMRAYYAGISFMDDRVGAVLDHAEKKGLLDNTIVVFMGDHGYQVGEKNYFNKGLLFERSCRTPLLIAAPDMKSAGGTSERVVELVDLFPTLAELCGVETPEGLDGVSLVPQMDDPAAPGRDIAYSYCNADRSVRDPRFRYIVWKGGGHALYDHAKDPDEHYNLADNPEYAPVVKRMSKLIDEMPEPGE